MCAPINTLLIQVLSLGGTAVRGLNAPYSSRARRALCGLLQTLRPEHYKG